MVEAGTRATGGGNREPGLGPGTLPIGGGSPYCDYDCYYCVNNIKMECANELNHMN